MFRLSYMVFGILVTLVSWFSFCFFPSCPSCLAKCKQRLHTIFVTLSPKVTKTKKSKMEWMKQITQNIKALLPFMNSNLPWPFLVQSDLWMWGLAYVNQLCTMYKKYILFLLGKIGKKSRILENWRMFITAMALVAQTVQKAKSCASKSHVCI